MSPRVELHEKAKPPRCVVCWTEDGELARCPRCGAPTHSECFPGRCPTLGCAVSSFVVDRARAARDAAEAYAEGRRRARELICTCGHSLDQHGSANGEMWCGEHRARRDSGRGEPCECRAFVDAPFLPGDFCTCGHVFAEHFGNGDESWCGICEGHPGNGCAGGFSRSALTEEGREIAIARGYIPDGRPRPHRASAFFRLMRLAEAILRERLGRRGEGPHA